MPATGTPLPDFFRQLSDEEFVNQTYMTHLGRPPDSAGGASYLARVRAGIARDEIWNEIGGSEEAQSVRQGRLGSSASASTQSMPIDQKVRRLLKLEGEPFVRAAYQELFKREADPAGLQTYLGLLEAGRSTHYVLKALYDSPEGIEKAPRNIGIERIVNRYMLAQRSNLRGYFYRTVYRLPFDVDAK